ncbi:ATP-binding protein [Psittacicella gerlachiana]|uniref:Helicase HerA central domain-containing protein n=1 Tax=Psittacicella gerlachiana TaxID=2028574 RepID=A0A3A1Y226_9GAMM|nr:ATP-binding protein [Psittacicella gerlachiana]RIY32382.1 hypothetical protein CKF59_07010 [Psittacicella gerlachiana]
MNSKWFSPHIQEWFIGTLTEISATTAKVNLIPSRLHEYSLNFGTKIPIGVVNSFVFIDCGEYSLFGRLIEVLLETKERLTVDDKNISNHPIGIIQLLTSIDTSNGKNYLGIQEYPNLGAQVYSAHPDLVTILASNNIHNRKEDITFPIAKVPNSNIHIHVTPEKLFGRHCAILGSTGGGKSYTLANLIEHVQIHGGKALLIDATGEYKDFPFESYYVGDNPNYNNKEITQVTFPHWMFNASCIRNLLRPSFQTQAPKLALAINKLKSENKEYNPYSESLSKNNDYSYWPFYKLKSKIEDISKQSEIDYCLTLFTRIEFITGNKSLKWMIDCDKSLTPIPEIIQELCANDNKIIRLDLSYVPSSDNAKELLVNAIGECLLDCAKSGAISNKNPLIVFIDEAHQFLNKRIGDEFFNFELDSFGNIAKEGRKYGLTTVIATQRPRDIPESVLSQIGTLIAHKLTNEKDQDLIRRAVGAIDSKSISFLPILKQGEALLLGVDFPFPINVNINKPNNEPHSQGPNYSNWKKSNKTEAI